MRSYPGEFARHVIGYGISLALVGWLGSELINEPSFISPLGGAGVGGVVGILVGMYEFKKKTES